MKNCIIFLLCIVFLSCNQEPENSHQEPTHNFTVDRLIILNDKNEIFMVLDQDVWSAPSYTFSERQFANESLDSLTTAYGITTTQPELRGYFGFKYEYHPYATRRAFYLAKYTGGNPKLPAPMKAYKWMTLEEASEVFIVDAWRPIFKNIIENPETFWGASFEVYRDGTDHRTRIVEDFYPLFTAKTN